VRARVQFCCNADGSWSVQLPLPGCRFTADSLSEAFNHAKRACAAAPAIIELSGAEGYVLSVVEDRGWPEPLCRTANSGRRGAPIATKLAAFGHRLRIRVHGQSWAYR
jgi:hypothetical protein